MQFNKMLKDSAKKFESIVCMGLDPVIERIPIEEGSIEDKITEFYSRILDQCEAENVFPSAVKPNYAFYAQYGFQGIRALKKVIQKAREMELPVILDAKRNDIGNTVKAYVKESFEFFEADSVTLNAFLGRDSIEPFLEEARQGKGSYLLVRTSNPGAEDFQNLKVGKKFLFEVMAEKLIEWAEDCKGNVGAVVGATSLKEFELIAEKFMLSRNEVPLLIPGVGAQGGTASEVVKVLKENNYPLELVRINASRSINYAFEKGNSKNYAEAAVNELKKMNEEINSFDF